MLLRGQSTRPSNVVGLIRQSLASFTFEHSACQTEIDHRCTEEIAIGILRNIVRVHKRIEYIQKFVRIFQQKVRLTLLFQKPEFSIFLVMNLS